MRWEFAEPAVRKILQDADANAIRANMCGIWRLVARHVPTAVKTEFNFFIYMSWRVPRRRRWKKKFVSAIVTMFRRAKNRMRADARSVIVFFVPSAGGRLRGIITQTIFRNVKPKNKGDFYRLFCLPR